VLRDINLKFELVLRSQDEIFGVASNHTDADKQLHTLDFDVLRGVAPDDARDHRADALEQEINLHTLLGAAEECAVVNTLGGHDERFERITNELGVRHEVRERSEQFDESSLGRRVQHVFRGRIVKGLTEVGLHILDLRAALVPQHEVGAQHQATAKEQVLVLCSAAILTHHDALRA
jgi:hypothetical protein